MVNSIHITIAQLALACQFAISLGCDEAPDPDAYDDAALDLEVSINDADGIGEPLLRSDDSTYICLSAEEAQRIEDGSETSDHSVSGTVAGGMIVLPGLMDHSEVED